MARSKKLCAFCGVQKSTTRDHVPPKGIFGRPLPNNMITVPSCSSCHSETSDDDTYFRTILIFRDYIGDHKDAKKVMELAVRGLKKKKSIGFTRSLLKRLEPVNLVTESGLFIGKGGRIKEVEIDRLITVANRTIRGLFYHNFNSPVPQQYQVNSYLVDSFPRLTPEFRLQVAGMMNFCDLGTSQQVGNFYYSFNSPSDCPSATAWVLKFYDVPVFLSLIGVQ